MTYNILTTQHLISYRTVYFSPLLRKGLSLTLVANIVKGKYSRSSSKVNPEQLFSNCSLTTGQGVLSSSFSARFDSSARLGFNDESFEKNRGVSENRARNGILSS